MIWDYDTLRLMTKIGPWFKIIYTRTLIKKTSNFKNKKTAHSDNHETRERLFLTKMIFFKRIRAGLKVGPFLRRDEEVLLCGILADEAVKEHLKNHGNLLL
jgi:hypothetical protein